MRRRNFIAPICTVVARSIVAAAITICVALFPLSTYAQESSPQLTVGHDLQSIVDAKVLRVAVTKFDLTSKWLSKLGAHSG
jgi:hypothetical protein